MNFNNIKAINFSYLLVEYYKKIGLTELELSVILMVEHLLDKDNTFVDGNSLSMYMNLSAKEIDKIITGLYKKSFLNIEINENGLSIDLSNLRKILYKNFENSIFTEDEINRNEKMEKARIFATEELKKLLQRDLTPIESSRIDDWVSSGTDIDVLENAFKDAKNKNIKNINDIDRIILTKIREEDRAGNEIK